MKMFLTSARFALSLKLYRMTIEAGNWMVTGRRLQIFCTMDVGV
jgi:hypothetical protein